MGTVKNLAPAPSALRGRPCGQAILDFEAPVLEFDLPTEDAVVERYRTVPMPSTAFARSSG